MDTEQKYAQASEEEEKGNVQERCQRFDRPRNMQPLDAFGKECPDPRSFAWTASWVRDSEITPRPLLQQCCQKRAGKTDDQTQEQQRVDPNSCCRWRERISGVGQRRRDDDLGSIFIGEQLINVREVER